MQQGSSISDLLNSLDATTYFFVSSGIFIAVTAVLYFGLGMWLGQILWGRFKRRFRQSEEAIEAYKGEVALLKRRLAEQVTRPAHGAGPSPLQAIAFKATTQVSVVPAAKELVPVQISARALVPSARCLPDEVIRGVGASGGVMGIFMMSMWLTTDPQPGVDAYIRQITHVANIAGIDGVGIANDYTIAGELTAAKAGNDNGKIISNYYPWWESVGRQGVFGFDGRPPHAVIPELNNVRRMFLIEQALQKSGFKAAEIEKIMGGNWIRVLTDTLG